LKKTEVMKWKLAVKGGLWTVEGEESNVLMSQQRLAALTRGKPGPGFRCTDVIALRRSIEP
jgi:hypothetical protein